MTLELPDQINGFIPIPLLVRESTSDTEPVYHILYAKKHQTHKTGSTDNTTDRTIFITNLPVDASHSSIKSLCHFLGNTILESFIPEKNYNRGLVVLVDKASCSRFLTKAKQQNPVPWSPQEPTGSEAYYLKNRIKYPDEGELQHEVDTYMEEFAQAEETKRQQVVDKLNLVDEDGFTMVVGSKRKSLAGIATAQKATEQFVAEQSAKKKRKKEKADFYRFQIREQKKTEMNDLLRRFQQDKLKVKELKERKRFKPY
ncbi:Rrp7p [Sugiyamaella lignohabitans]|uniref:Rrp7p n=1 Tax=Sugiyamaella lignohabitans TaxID=796027 RepID=A0A167FFG4_9ASCO|nr:Rrp7p [Sugiyamaella lignohabitans]ANB15234.1 Rrp7p [Sugiyamaella lignohabitans]